MTRSFFLKLPKVHDWTGALFAVLACHGLIVRSLLIEVAFELKVFSGPISCLLLIIVLSSIQWLLHLPESKLVQAYPLGNWAEVGYGESKQIAVGNDRNGSLVVFSIGMVDNAIYRKHQLPNSTWSTDWIPLGGESKQIAVGNDRNGSLVVFSTGMADSMPYYKQQLPNGTWSTDWIPLGGESKQIAVGNDRDRNLVAFSVGLNSKTPHFKHQLPNSTWSTDWIPLGGESKQIAVGNDRNGSLVVFSIGLADNAIYRKHQLPNGTWSTDWIPLGGPTKRIAIVSTGDSHGPLVVSIADFDSSVYFWYTPSININSSGIPLGGFSAAVSVINGKNNDPHIFSIAKDSGSVFEYKINEEPLINSDKFDIETFFYGNLSSSDTATTSMAFLDRENVLLLEKNDGRVRLISNGKLDERPLLDLNVNGLGERGLLGVAVKDITSNEINYRMDQGSQKFVFLYLTESLTDGATPLGNRVYRYEFNGTDLIYPVLLLDLPASYLNHNAGKIKVAPDGTIFVIIGDQNRSGIFQNLNASDTSPTGVIYHIDSTGNPSPKNPFYNSTSNKLIQSIYAYGIRNSFGLAVDPITGTLWDTENGDVEYDEINQVNPGFNGGWKVISGPAQPPDKSKLEMLPNSHYRDPVISYKDSIGITDLEFISSDMYGLSAMGSLLVGDINNGNLYLFHLNSTRDGISVNNETLSSPVIDKDIFLKKITLGSGFGSGITDIEKGPDGWIYILTLGGKIFRLLPV